MLCVFVLLISALHPPTDRHSQELRAFRERYSVKKEASFPKICARDKEEEKGKDCGDLKKKNHKKARGKSRQRETRVSGNIRHKKRV